MVDRDADELSSLPLERDAHGEAVADLQQRLRKGGFLAPGETRGTFDSLTQHAVLAFQDHAGLPPSGICDQATWSCLVEAGFTLGDRLLYLRRPMLRGDDVALLQQHLSELGFQRGRVDGIFGPDTEAAVVTFQRNTGLVTDGVAGPDVLAQLRRFGPGTGRLSKASLAERLDLLNGPKELANANIAVAECGDLPAFLRALTSRLDRAGADTLAIHHPEGSIQALEANRFNARCFLGWATRREPGITLAYYRTQGFESAGGNQLAQMLARHLQTASLAPPVIQGMRTAVLRETKMPALWVELGPTAWIVQHGNQIGLAVQAALQEWLAAPLGYPSP